jgi:ferric-dicitrate binding protein FerR (iron transport regulator)
MLHPQLKDLLRKLFNGKIDYAHFSELKNLVQDATDKELQSELSELWDNHRLAEPMDSTQKFDVLSTIQEEIGQEIPDSSPSVNWWKYAAIITIPLLVTASYFFVFQRAEQRNFVVFTEEGQKSQVLLPDGSKVWLNGGSKLTYSNDFSEDNRRVQLSGEGFFEVKKDEKHQFSVETEQVNVEVHGTAFNVEAYPEDKNIKVSLLNGKVALINRRNQLKMLDMVPGYQVAVSKNTLKWTNYSCDVETEALWVKNMLRFENATADQVFIKLEHWYGLKIDVENKDNTIRYGFTLKSESIREMLDLINKITPITYKINGEEVRIRYK